MLVTEFLNLGIEEQSLYIRELFETAASNYSDSTKELCISIYENKAYLYLTENDSEILTSYNERLFPRAQYIPMGDGVSMIQITRETLFRYCSANVLSTIKEINQLGNENDWRSNEAIFDVAGSEPWIVFRGIQEMQEGTWHTPGYFYCDAQSIISQQLMNYQYVMRNKGLNDTLLFKHLSFPEMEGRGAVFSFNGIPFHAYNAKLYNDALGEYLKLYSCDYDELFWSLDQTQCLIQGFTQTKLTISQGASLLPGIVERQKSDNYIDVIRTPLTTYIAHSLEFQKSLEPESRIAINNKKTSTEAIEDALNLLHTITEQAQKRSGNIANTFTFFKPEEAKLTTEVRGPSFELNS